MSLKKVNPTELAAPIGFSHGMVVNGGTLIFLAGQTALNKNNEIEGNHRVPPCFSNSILKSIISSGKKTKDFYRL